MTRKLTFAARGSTTWNQNTGAGSSSPAAQTMRSTAEAAINNMDRAAKIPSFSSQYTLFFFISSLSTHNSKNGALSADRAPFRCTYPLTVPSALNTGRGARNLMSSRC